MNRNIVIFNFTSAFFIGGGTAFMCVIAGGSPPNMWQVIGCVVTGLVVAYKDTRSLLKLPPVENQPK